MNPIARHFDLSDCRLYIVEIKLPLPRIRHKSTHLSNLAFAEWAVTWNYYLLSINESALCIKHVVQEPNDSERRGGPLDCPIYKINDRLIICFLVKVEQETLNIVVLIAF